MIDKPPEGGNFFSDSLEEQLSATTHHLTCFVLKYADIISEGRIPIYRFGYREDESFIDLHDCKEQLKKEWVGVIALNLYKNQDEYSWMYSRTEGAYMGRKEYSFDPQFNIIFLADYGPAGKVARIEITDDEQEVSGVINNTLKIIQSEQVIKFADGIIAARQKIRDLLGELQSVAEEDRNLAQKKQIKNAQDTLKQLYIKKPWSKK